MGQSNVGNRPNTNHLEIGRSQINGSMYVRYKETIAQNFPSVKEVYMLLVLFKSKSKYIWKIFSII